MMSKERDLLRRMSTHSGRVSMSYFIDEIKELLAQPEQDLQEDLREEPIGWIYDYISPTSVKHTTAIFDKYPYEDWMINIRPLYTLPPKRKPLSGEDIGKGFLLTDVWYRYECFIAGVKWAERHHGITGGEE